MKSVKILYNQNKLCNEISSDAFYANECSEFSIRLVFSGFEQYHLGKRELNIYPGNFLVINEGTTYSRKIYSDIPSNTFSILYSSNFLRNFHSNIILSDEHLLDDPFNLTQIEGPAFLETIYPFKGHMKYNLLHLRNHFNDNAIEDLLLDEYMYHSLLLFYQLYNQEIVSKSSQLNISNNKTRIEIFKRLSIAKDFIISNYNQDITLDDISNSACLSAPHLFRTFKQTFNCSPHQYLMQIRLKNASHLLKTTDYSLNEIVNMVGLTCTSTFIKIFKNKFCLTPRHYRINQEIQLGQENNFRYSA
jgi:AraC family transcriptional regulator